MRVATVGHSKRSPAIFVAVLRAHGVRHVVGAPRPTPGQCHRRLLAYFLVLRGDEIVHLLDDTRAVAHELSPLARREGDDVRYDRGQRSLFG